MGEPITLVGDGIENPGNARVMLAAARMFGAGCRFRDRAGLADRWRETGSAELDLVSLPSLSHDYAPLSVLDNLPGATDIYGARLPSGPRPALVAGNERRGVAADVRANASCAIQIPMFGRSVNTLNVAAASAVALYYLSRGGGPRLQHSANPERRRPEVILAGADDHVELGSAIRSAAALGWERLLIEDRQQVWFGVERHMQSEGRAAARRHRNPIRLLPASTSQRYAFAEVCVVSAVAGATPLHRVNLARGPSQALVIPDESRIDVTAEDWERLGRSVMLVRLPLPGETSSYHYRLIASIALAEAARQVGRRPRPVIPAPERRPPAYDSAVRLLLDAEAELVFPDELERY